MHTLSLEIEEEERCGSSRRRALEDPKQRPIKRRRCIQAHEDELDAPSPRETLDTSSDDETSSCEADCPQPVACGPDVKQFMKKNEFLELALLGVSPDSPDFCDVVRFLCAAFVEAVSGVVRSSAVKDSASPPPASEEEGAEAIVLPDSPLDVPYRAVCHVSFQGTCAVVGDLHGDLDSLLYILKNIGGSPSESLHVVFNGDLIDRGPFSLKVALLVMALKAQFPDYVHVNRGNHEFMDQGLHAPHAGNLRADLGTHLELEDEIISALACLPLVHVLQGEGDAKVAVIHAGMPMDCNGNVASLDELSRAAQPNALYHAQLTMLEYSSLWNDPKDDRGLSASPRGGAAVLFGPDKTEEFLELNDLSLLVRSHQMVDGGYAEHHEGGVITVMSTIDDPENGSAAYMLFDSKDLTQHKHFEFSVEDIREALAEQPEQSETYEDEDADQE